MGNSLFQMKGFKTIFILIFLSFLSNTKIFGQEKKPEIKIHPDSLMNSISLDAMVILSSVIIEAEHKTDENLGLKLAIGGGYFPQDDSAIRNTTSNYNTSFIIKSGINLKMLSNKTGLESGVFGMEALFVHASHNTKVAIPHFFGTYTGNFNRSYNFWGLGFYLVKVAPVSQRFYIDFGPAFYLLSLKGSLLSESFIPGIGPTWHNKYFATFPTMAAFLKINLRYRF